MPTSKIPSAPLFVFRPIAGVHKLYNLLHAQSVVAATRHFPIQESSHSFCRLQIFEPESPVDSPAKMRIPRMPANTPPLRWCVPSHPKIASQKWLPCWQVAWHSRHNNAINRSCRRYVFHDQNLSPATRLLQSLCGLRKSTDKPTFQRHPLQLLPETPRTATTLTHYENHPLLFHLKSMPSCCVRVHAYSDSHSECAFSSSPIHRSMACSASLRVLNVVQ